MEQLIQTRLHQKIQGYYNLSDEREIREFELAQVDDFLFWSRKTWCRFEFVYCNNRLNKKLGRVGRSSGTRYGTRFLDLVPTKDKPKKRNPSTKTYRYYDTGRPTKNSTKNTGIRDAQGRYTQNRGQAIKGSWRSFRPDCFIVLTGIWSYERGKFVSDYSDFNIRNQPTS
ncbi:hypothetical protein EFA69_06560 [Rufibacter immobilis]|uniref:Uncharacterized protein n=1 Tax=Rufibacter immobilis TaxID=1348778 RepID=A0A3M9MZH1_9BACT|nr:hypothetical protein [Rufibacter immobilis]RNI30949.1 hypothetical protein EFA69_06560 [Rufibacter immobilis]